MTYGTWKLLKFIISFFQRICMTIRDPTRDGCIKEFIKQKRSSGLFLAVGAAEKKNSKCHKYATF